MDEESALQHDAVQFARKYRGTLKVFAPDFLKFLKKLALFLNWFDLEKELSA